MRELRPADGDNKSIKAVKKFSFVPQGARAYGLAGQSCAWQGKSANFSKYGFSLKPKLNFVTLVLLKPPKSMPVSKYGQQRENGKKITKT